MSVEQAISEITSLPLEDQLRIVQTVWDRMPAEAGTSLTAAQRSEFDKRVNAYQSNPETSLSESQLREQLRKI